MIESYQPDKQDVQKAESIMDDDQKERSEERAKLYDRVRVDFGKKYDSNEKAEDAIEETLLDLEFFFSLENFPLDAEKIKNDLRSCRNAKTRDKFVDQAVSVFGPFMDCKIDNPILFEEMERSFSASKEGRTTINQLVGYDREKDGWLSIHIARNKTVSTNEKRQFLSFFKEGMKEIALFAQKESIKGVWAESWIIAEHPDILKRFGFNVEGNLDKETVENKYPEEEREVGRAYITSEELINKFL